MSKWKKGLSSWPCSVLLITAVLSLLIFLPLTRNLRQILMASSSIKPIHFWQMEIQNSQKKKPKFFFSHIPLRIRPYFRPSANAAVCLSPLTIRHFRSSCPISL
ncbi:hypothetical protein [Holdemania massiliensis]|uniref:hypothetical protein n=1 Tax=Holdemania massiliensis TaxID=1468449 RepID=UPI0011C82116|nr:hypothetical protein [Holdemania massiliensis]